MIWIYKILMLVQQLILQKENINIKIDVKMKIIKYMCINLLDKMEDGIIGKWLKFKNIIV